MVYYPMSVLMLAGIRDILVVSDPTNIEFYKILFGDGSHLGMHISYAVQDEPRGIADVFIVGESFINGEKTALILGDNVFYGTGFTPILQKARELTERRDHFWLLRE